MTRGFKDRHELEGMSAKTLLLKRAPSKIGKHSAKQGTTSHFWKETGFASMGKRGTMRRVYHIQGGH